MLVEVEFSTRVLGEFFKNNHGKKDTSLAWAHLDSAYRIGL